MREPRRGEREGPTEYSRSAHRTVGSTHVGRVANSGVTDVSGGGCSDGSGRRAAVLDVVGRFCMETHEDREFVLPKLKNSVLL